MSGGQLSIFIVLRGIWPMKGEEPQALWATAADERQQPPPMSVGAASANVRPILPTSGRQAVLIPVGMAKSIKGSGIEALKKISQLNNNVRFTGHNVQTIWASFKSEITQVAKAREKAIVPKIIQQQRKLQDAQHRVTNSNTTLEKEKAARAAEITQKIQDLELKRHSKVRSNVATTVKSIMRHYLVNGSKEMKKGNQET
ncbi:hypothetical protein C8J57DRAFT_1227858 [Mycena rebaudengoi]|nr:hypothetical protein C8J57DRAFT_1227858 [Mycena rebaudengoi]